MADDLAAARAPVAAPDTPAPRRWSAADFDLLIETGAAARLGRIELRGGEIWTMSPQYVPHMAMKLAVYRSLESALKGQGVVVGVEVTVAFAEYRPYPDITVFTDRGQRKAVPGADVRLIVEVSDTTLSDDLGDKKSRYAAAGVAEYWVIDMAGRQVLRFDQPRDGAFRAAAPVAAGREVSGLTVPGLAIASADWPWDEA
jgi:Uma2 family endonuclease